MGTGTKKEVGVLQVRADGISDHLGDGSRDGEWGAVLGCWSSFEEEKPVEFSTIKCGRERRRIRGSENLGWSS